MVERDQSCLTTEGDSTVNASDISTTLPRMKVGTDVYAMSSVGEVDDLEQMERHATKKASSL